MAAGTRSSPVRLPAMLNLEFYPTGRCAQEALQVAQLMAIVSTDRLNARTEPNTDAPIWTQISNSERYTVMSQQDGWVQIALDETSAYVATEFVDVRYALNEAIEFTPVEETPEPETKAASSQGGSGSKSNSKGGSSSQKASSSGSSKRAQIENYATQFLGNPYVWGGTSLTNGADCSGFTMSVMAHFGVSLPHHSGSQAGAGKKYQFLPDASGRSDLLYKQRRNNQSCSTLYWRRTRVPCVECKVRYQDFHLELSYPGEDRQRIGRLIS